MLEKQQQQQVRPSPMVKPKISSQMFVQAHMYCNFVNTQVYRYLILLHYSMASFRLFISQMYMLSALVQQEQDYLLTSKLSQGNLEQPCSTSGQSQCCQNGHFGRPNAPLPQKKVETHFCLALQLEK